MKPSRQNKVIGLALGESSLMAAEIVEADRPSTQRLAEFVYPAGLSIQKPAELGAALGAFLKEREFTAKSVVVGIPARWLLVKPKEVPPADADTLSEMLRLQAEGEFSSELKDLVYDYAAGDQTGDVRSVLLIATAKKYVDGARQLCEAAKLNAVAVMPSAVALSTATSIGSKDAMVLAINSSGAELTAQSGGVASAIRHLRGPGAGAERAFVGDLRRAVSTMPGNGTPRELVLWDQEGLDIASLSQSLGINVRSGDLPVMGIDTPESERNGDGRRYAAAVALALSGIREARFPIDFLHSRLAPPKPQLIPRWALAAAIGGLLVIVLIVLAYTDLQTQQSKLDKLNNTLNGEKDQIVAAQLFVDKVSVALAWHGGNPRYLACMRDITNAIPNDNTTYATSVHISESPKPQGSGNPSAPKPVDLHTLNGQLLGKTDDQQKVQVILDQMKRNPSFQNVKNGGSVEVVAGRTREVSFSINFVYLPPKLTR